MTTVSLEVTNPSVNQRLNEMAVARWEGLTGTDDGEPVTLVAYGDRSVQVAGTFAGGTPKVIIQGSNDGVNWITMRDPFNQPLEFTANGLRTVVDVAVYMRPLLEDAAGSDIDVTMLMRR